MLHGVPGPPQVGPGEDRVDLHSVVDSVVEVVASLVVEDSKTLNVVDGTMMVLLPRMMLLVNEAGEVMVKS